MKRFSGAPQMEEIPSAPPKIPVMDVMKGGHWPSNNHTTPTATSNAHTPLGDVVAYGVIDDKTTVAACTPPLLGGGLRTLRR